MFSNKCLAPHRCKARKGQFFFPTPLSGELIIKGKMVLISLLIKKIYI